MKTQKTNVKPADVGYRTLATGKISAPNKRNGGPKATRTVGTGDLRTRRSGKV